MDEHAGKGGAYIFDAKTGTRKLIERTVEPGEEVNATPPAEKEKTSFDKKSKKG